VDVRVLGRTVALKLEAMGRSTIPCSSLRRRESGGGRRDGVLVLASWDVCVPVDHLITTYDLWTLEIDTCVGYKLALLIIIR
jgi:hypothetical protein